MAKLVHSMIRVLDEARSTEFYRKAFDLQPVDRFAFETFTLVYLRSPASAFELELTVNHDRREPYALGDGYGHLAVVVDDVEAEHRRFEQLHLRPGPLRELRQADKLLARFFFVQDPDGYKIEVLQQQGRYA